MGKRFRKRLKFAIEKEEDILREQGEQKVTNEQYRIIEKVDAIMEERRRIRENKERMF